MDFSSFKWEQLKTFWSITYIQNSSCFKMFSSYTRRRQLASFNSYYYFPQTHTMTMLIKLWATALRSRYEFLKTLHRPCVDSNPRSSGMGADAMTIPLACLISYDKILFVRQQWERVKLLTAILNFTPGSQGRTSPLGANLAPKGEICPLGVNLAPKGEMCPLGEMFTPSITPRGEHSTVLKMEGWTENFTPRGQNSPLGDNFTPGFKVCP
jgi:hypothetical protein